MKIDIWRNTQETSLDGEVWLRVALAPDYEVSNLGRIRVMINRDNRNGRDFWIGKIITQNKYSGRHYLRVNLRVGDKLVSFNAHRLVAEAFVSGRTSEKDFVNHIDAHPDNNFYKNLEWVTAQENVDHAVEMGLRWYRKGSDRSDSKLKEFQVIEILRAYWIDFRLSEDISKEYGLSPKYGKLICVGRRWVHIYNYFIEKYSIDVEGLSVIIKKRRNSNLDRITEQLKNYKGTYEKLE